MTTMIRDMFGPHKPKTVRGVPDKVLPQIPEQRYVACPDGNRLVDLATGKYYVSERLLMEHANKKLERAARLAEESDADHAAVCIRALKESL